MGATLKILTACIATLGPARAAVIYNDDYSRLLWINQPINQTFDLDGNGTIDFDFRMETWQVANIGGIQLRFYGSNSSHVYVTEEDLGRGPTPVPEGSIIGPIEGETIRELTIIRPADGESPHVWRDLTNDWTALTTRQVSSQGDIGTRGTFNTDSRNPESLYLGFSFTSEEGRHYGFFKIKTLQARGVEFLEYAYESEPDIPIIAGVPEPSGTAFIMLSSLLLLKRRR